MTLHERIKHLKLTQPSLSQGKIADIVGCSRSHVSMVLSGRGSYDKSRPRRTRMNGERLKLQDELRHDSFSKQTPESDFWAGYICGDGCIFKEKVQIGCASVDEEFLRCFLSWCNSGHKLSRVDYKKGGTGVSGGFKSTQMVSDLLEYYNIGPRKSMNEIPPNRKSLEFVAGLFAADGCISLRKSRRYYTCGFCGSRTMMEYVKSNFLDLSKSNVTPISSIFAYNVAGRGGAREALTRIFDHSPFLMKRKYDKHVHNCLLNPLS